MEMSYEKMLNFCKNNEVDGAKVYIAYEMNYQFCDRLEMGYTQNRFEELCCLAYEMYLKTEDISITKICITMADLEFDFRQEKGEDPMTMNKWDILDKASCC